MGNNSGKRLHTLLMVVFYTFTALAGGNPGEHQKWHPMEIHFQGPDADEMDDDPNPFLDYRLQVLFTSPDGERYLVPGFFNGDGNGVGKGQVWTVRFSP